MSFVGGAFQMGTGPSSAMRFAQTRGRIQGSVQGVNYPSPFFDVAHTYLPVTVKQLFRWCRYYFLTNPLINAAIFKLSEYPVTDIVIDHEDPKVVKHWTDFFQDSLLYRSFQIECNLDYNTYGNGLVSMGFPFKKYLTCRSCAWSEQAGKIRARWTFTNHEFRLNCPRCGTVENAVPEDKYLKSASGIKLIRWNCENVEITYNDLMAETTHFYDVPGPVRNDIVIGKKDVVEAVPQVFIQALRQQKGIVFNKENLFHLKRPTLAQQDRGWGVPLILPVLKDTFYLQIMKKAQEALLLEHIVPLRILFPQAGSGSSDPYTTINLVDWRDQIAAEIARWRHDCVSPETLVETRGGLMRADEVQEGEELKNHTGTFSKVVKSWRRPLREGERAYKVRARGLTAVNSVFSEGHPLWAAKKFNNGNGHKLGVPGVIRVKDLRVGDYIGYPVGREVVSRHTLDLSEHVDRAATDRWVYVDHVESAVPEAFEYLEQNGSAVDRHALLESRGWSINQYKIAQLAHREERALRRLPRHLPFDRELAWVVGMYLAEGSSTPKQVMFALHESELDAQERLKVFFAERFGASSFTARRSTHGVQVYFSSVVAAQFFGNLCPGDSRTKSVPAVYASASDELVIALLRGMLDGDGCWHEDGSSNRISYCSASLQLAEDCRRALLSLGVPATITFSAPHAYDILGKVGMSAGAYRVGVHGPAKARLDALFARTDAPIVESSNSGVFRDGYFWHRVDEIAEVEVEEVIGFQLDPDAAHVLVDGERHGSFCTWGMAGVNSNYIPILPLPIGNQTVGGDGRALLLSQEIQQWSDQIIMGMGVPIEFLRGGMSYAGTNVSMRMLENQFLGTIMRHKNMARWVMKMAAHYMGWPEANVRFKPFKMADDIQRKAYLFQLNQAQKVSDTTLLADADLSQDDEDEIMLRETAKRLEASKKQQLAMAEIQAEAQVVMAKAQVKAQQVMAEAQAAPAAPGEPDGPEAAGGSPGGQEAAAAPPASPLESMQSPLNAGASMGGQPAQQPGIDIRQMAGQLAQQIAQLDPSSQQAAIQNLRAQSPELADLVQQYLAQQGSQSGGQQSGQQVSVDMRPMPEKLPPRRAAGMI